MNRAQGCRRSGSRAGGRRRRHLVGRRSKAEPPPITGRSGLDDDVEHPPLVP